MRRALRGSMLKVSRVNLILSSRLISATVQPAGLPLLSRPPSVSVSISVHARRLPFADLYPPTPRLTPEPPRSVHVCEANSRLPYASDNIYIRHTFTIAYRRLPPDLPPQRDLVAILLYGKASKLEKERSGEWNRNDGGESHSSPIRKSD